MTITPPHGYRIVDPDETPDERAMAWDEVEMRWIPRSWKTRKLSYVRTFTYAVPRDEPEPQDASRVPVVAAWAIIAAAFGFGIFLGVFGRWLATR